MSLHRLVLLRFLSFLSILPNVHAASLKNIFGREACACCQEGVCEAVNTATDTLRRIATQTGPPRVSTCLEEKAPLHVFEHTLKVPVDFGCGLTCGDVACKLVLDVACKLVNQPEKLREIRTRSFCKATRLAFTIRGWCGIRNHLRKLLGPTFGPPEFSQNVYDCLELCRSKHVFV